jgi:hypothetical protein
MSAMFRDPLSVPRSCYSRDDNPIPSRFLADMPAYSQALVLAVARLLADVPCLFPSFFSFFLPRLPKDHIRSHSRFFHSLSRSIS